jgi:hypothetical protein
LIKVLSPNPKSGKDTNYLHTGDEQKMGYKKESD